MKPPASSTSSSSRRRPDLRRRDCALPAVPRSAWGAGGQDGVKRPPCARPSLLLPCHSKLEPAQPAMKISGSSMSRSSSAGSERGQPATRSSNSSGRYQAATKASATSGRLTSVPARPIISASSGGSSPASSSGAKSTGKLARRSLAQRTCRFHTCDALRVPTSCGNGPASRMRWPFARIILVAAASSAGSAASWRSRHGQGRRGGRTVSCPARSRAPACRSRTACAPGRN